MMFDFLSFSRFYTLSLLLISLAVPAKVIAEPAAQAVDITQPESVLELAMIEQKMDDITQTLLVCVQAGKQQAACLCDDIGSIKAFSDLVKAVDARHPEWKDLDIVRYPAADGTWVSQSLYGLRRQASSQPFCP